MSINRLDTSFLIVSHWNGSDSLLKIKEQFKNLFEDKQHFEILLFTHIKRPKEGFEIPSRMYIIAKNDFNLFGKLKSKKSYPTEYTYFDVCFLVDEYDKAQDNVIKAMKIKHVVSFGYERSFVNINLQTSYVSSQEKIKFALAMLSKISD